MHKRPQASVSSGNHVLANSKTANFSSIKFWDKNDFSKMAGVKIDQTLVDRISSTCLRFKSLSEELDG